MSTETPPSDDERLILAARALATGSEHPAWATTLRSPGLDLISLLGKLADRIEVLSAGRVPALPVPVSDDERLIQAAWALSDRVTASTSPLDRPGLDNAEQVEALQLLRSLAGRLKESTGSVQDGVKRGYALGRKDGRAEMLAEIKMSAVDEPQPKTETDGVLQWDGRPATSFSTARITHAGSVRRYGAKGNGLIDAIDLPRTEPVSARPFAFYFTFHFVDHEGNAAEMEHRVAVHAASQAMDPNAPEPELSFEVLGKGALGEPKWFPRSPHQISPRLLLRLFDLMAGAVTPVLETQDGARYIHVGVIDLK